MKNTINLLLLFICFSTIGQDYLNFVPYRKGDLWGFADRAGKIVIPCEYSSAKVFEENGFAIVEKNNKSTIIDSKGKQAFTPLPLTLVESNEGIYTTLYQDEKSNFIWGYVNQMGEKIGENYNSVSKFSEGLARVQNEKKKYGFIDKKGKLVIACKYSFAFDFQEGIAVVEKASRYGGIDKTGKMIIPFQYSRLFPFKDGYAKIGGILKITDTSEPSDDPNEINVSATISVMDTPDLRFIDKNNKVYQMGNYEKIPNALKSQLYPNGMARNFYMSPQKVYYQNEKNKYIVKGKYYWGDFFKEELAIVISKKGDKKLYGFINKEGKEVVIPKYENAKQFHNGFACVQKNDKWGFIDQTGKLIIPCKFDDYGYFEKGIAWMEFNGKNGVINEKGDFIVNPEFSYGDLYRLHNLGLIEVKEGYIDSKGRKYWED